MSDHHQQPIAKERSNISQQQAALDRLAQLQAGGELTHPPSLPSSGPPSLPPSLPPSEPGTPRTGPPPSLPTSLPSSLPPSLPPSLPGSRAPSLPSSRAPSMPGTPPSEKDLLPEFKVYEMNQAHEARIHELEAQLATTRSKEEAMLTEWKKKELDWQKEQAAATLKLNEANSRTTLLEKQLTESRQAQASPETEKLLIELQAHAVDLEQQLVAAKSKEQELIVQNAARVKESRDEREQLEKTHVADMAAERKKFVELFEADKKVHELLQKEQKRYQEMEQKYQTQLSESETKLKQQLAELEAKLKQQQTERESKFHAQLLETETKLKSENDQLKAKHEQQLEEMKKRHEASLAATTAASTSTDSAAHQLAELTAKYDDLVQQLSRANEQLKEKESKLQTLTTEHDAKLQSLTNEHQKATTELITTHETKLTDATTQLHALKSAHEGTKKVLDAEREAAKSQLAKHELTIQELNSNLQTTHDQLKAAEAAAASSPTLDATLQTSQDEIARLQNLEVELLTLRKQLSEQATSLPADFDNVRRTMAREMLEAASLLDEAEQTQISMETEIETLQQAQQTLQQEVATLQSQNAALNNVMEQLQVKNQEMEDELTTLHRKVLNVETALEESQGENLDLSEKFEAEQAAAKELHQQLEQERANLERVKTEHALALEEVQQQLERSHAVHAQEIEELQQQAARINTEHTLAAEDLQQQLEQANAAHAQTTAELQQQLDVLHGGHASTTQELTAAQEKIAQLERSLQVAQLSETNTVTEVEQLATQFVELKTRFEETNKQLAEQQTNNHQLEETNNALQQQLAERIEETQKLEIHLKDVSFGLEQQRTEHAELQSNLKESSALLTLMEKENHELKQAMHEQDQQHQQQLKAKEHEASSIAATTAGVAGSIELTRLQAELKSAQAEAAQKQTELDSLKLEYAQLKEKEAQALQQHTENESKLHAQLLETETKLKSTHEQLEEIQKRHEASLASFTAASTSTDSAAHQLAELTAKYDALAQQLNHANEQLNEKDVKIQTLMSEHQKTTNELISTHETKLNDANSLLDATRSAHEETKKVLDQERESSKAHVSQLQSEKPTTTDTSALEHELTTVKEELRLAQLDAHQKQVDLDALTMQYAQLQENEERLSLKLVALESKPPSTPDTTKFDLELNFLKEELKMAQTELTNKNKELELKSIEVVELRQHQPTNNQPTVAHDLDELKAELKGAQEEVANKSKELEELRQQLTAAQDELASQPATAKKMAPESGIPGKSAGADPAVESASEKFSTPPVALTSEQEFLELTSNEQYALYQKQVEHVHESDRLLDEATNFIVEREKQLLELIEKLNVDNDQLHFQCSEVESKLGQAQHDLTEANAKCTHFETQCNDLTTSLNELTAAHAQSSASLAEYQEEIEKLVKEVQALEKENETSKLLLASANTFNHPPTSPANAVPASSTTSSTPASSADTPSIAELQTRNSILEAKVQKLQVQLSTALSESEQPAFNPTEGTHTPSEKSERKRLFSDPSEPWQAFSGPAVAYAAEELAKQYGGQQLVDLKIVVNVLPEGSLAPLSAIGASSVPTSTLSVSSGEPSVPILAQHVTDLTQVVSSLRQRIDWLEDELHARDAEIETYKLSAKTDAPPSSTSNPELAQTQTSLLTERNTARNQQLSTLETKNNLLQETVTNLKSVNERIKQQLTDSLSANQLALAKALSERDTLRTEAATVTQQFDELSSKYSALLQEFQVTLQHAEHNDHEYKSAIAALQKHYDDEIEELHAKLNVENTNSTAAEPTDTSYTALAASPTRKRLFDFKTEVARSAGAPASSTSTVDSSAPFVSPASPKLSSIAGVPTSPVAVSAQLHLQIQQLQRELDSLTHANKELELTNTQQAASLTKLQQLQEELIATQAQAQELQVKLSQKDRQSRQALVDLSAEHDRALEEMHARHAEQLESVRSKIKKQDDEEAATVSTNARERQLQTRIGDLLREHADEIEALKSAQARKVEATEDRYRKKLEAQKDESEEQLEQIKADHEKALQDLQHKHELATRDLTLQLEHSDAAHQVALHELTLKCKQEWSADQVKYENDLHAAQMKVSQLSTDLQTVQAALESSQAQLVQVRAELTKTVAAKNELEQTLAHTESNTLKREKLDAVKHEYEIHELQSTNQVLGRKLTAAQKRLDDLLGEREKRTDKIKEQLVQAESTVTELREELSQLKFSIAEKDRQYEQLETRFQEQTGELHELLRVKSEKQRSERLALLGHVHGLDSSPAADGSPTSLGSPSDVLNESDSVLEGLSITELLARYKTLRFTFEAHLNHVQEMTESLRSGHERDLALVKKDCKAQLDAKAAEVKALVDAQEKELNNVKKQHSLQDAQYHAAVTAMNEKHAQELASLTSLQSKLQIELDAKEKDWNREKKFLEDLLKKMNVNYTPTDLPPSHSTIAANSVPPSPRANPSVPTISSSHSLLLSEYQFLYASYHTLQQTVSKLQATNDSYATKLDSAKRLVIALNNERKDLLEYKTRKRKENEKLRAECKQYYAAYLTATQQLSNTSTMASPSLNGPTFNASPYSSPNASFDASAMFSSPMTPVRPEGSSRRVSLLQVDPSAPLNGGANGLSSPTATMTPTSKSSITLIPSTSSSNSSGYALRMSTEIIVTRELVMDTMLFLDYPVDLDPTTTTSDSQLQMYHAIEKEVEYLLDDYTLWQKQLEKALEPSVTALTSLTNGHGVNSSTKAKNRLLTELLSEVDRVNQNSHSRMTAITQLIGSTFQAAAKQRVERNGGVVPDLHGDSHLNGDERKDSQFVLQSDLQLIFIGQPTF